jgi:hypothetical protein
VKGPKYKSRAVNKIEMFQRSDLVHTGYPSATVTAMESLIVNGLSDFVSRRSSQVILMCVGGGRPFLQIEPPAAIGTINDTAIPEIEVD